MVLVKVNLMSSPKPEDDDSARLLTIGEVAERVNRRPSSIRYYEAIGLLPEPIRVNGRRRYQTDTIRTLAVIETARRGGLTLDEIKLLLDASPDDEASVDRLREVAERKLPEIEALLARAEYVRTWLLGAAQCQCPSLNDCPLFDGSS
jgi:MerR family transcriptional regulator, redox-sensitive transcriptional activator SoxR